MLLLQKYIVEFERWDGRTDNILDVWIYSTNATEMGQRIWEFQMSYLTDELDLRVCRMLKNWTPSFEFKKIGRLSIEECVRSIDHHINDMMKNLSWPSYWACSSGRTTNWTAIVSLTNTLSFVFDSTRTKICWTRVDRAPEMVLSDKWINDMNKWLSRIDMLTSPYSGQNEGNSRFGNAVKFTELFDNRDPTMFRC